MNKPAIQAIQPLPGSPIPPEMPPSGTPPLPQAPPDIDSPMDEPIIPVRDPGTTQPMRA